MLFPEVLWLFHSWLFLGATLCAPPNAFWIVLDPFGVTRSHRAVCISWWAAVGISWWAYRKVQPDDLVCPRHYVSQASTRGQANEGPGKLHVSQCFMCCVESAVCWDGTSVPQLCSWLVSDGSMTCVSIWVHATDSKALLPSVELSVFLHSWNMLEFIKPFSDFSGSIRNMSCPYGLFARSHAKAL